MALTLRQSWEGDRDRNDWTVYDDLLERPVGRIYEISTHGGEVLWVWIIHTGDAHGSRGTSGLAPTLEKAKAAVLNNWMAIISWSRD
jgi:hypothetical protein